MYFWHQRRRSRGDALVDGQVRKSLLVLTSVKYFIGELQYFVFAGRLWQCPVTPEGCGFVPHSVAVVSLQDISQKLRKRLSLFSREGGLPALSGCLGAALGPTDRYEAAEHRRHWCLHPPPAGAEVKDTTATEWHVNPQPSGVRVGHLTPLPLC
nr:uncharacterized protein LOC107395168 [Nothobranchius furzeri]